MTLPPPLTISYWFKPTPTLFIPVVNWIFLGLIACAVLAGFAMFFLKMRGGKEKLTKRALGKAGTFLLNFGLSGFVLYGLLYERVPYLSMRFWLLIWLVGFGYYAWLVYKYIFVEMVRIKQEKVEREKFEKWLPKKKD
ncbi:MAG: hypothetical protein ABIB04_01985 [Patescibacteria group bacterium]